ncbi:hypothetical protein [Bradyrhizobium sp. URHD0069]|uniref:hypothetical protein n=1 Tax=Bradyrhizobium sp. URHD0069 TaxID=1380355 RepID=UPI00068ACCFD|nr:hypothetical protein [Bradyrhizobium sp. URHD0069]
MKKNLDPRRDMEIPKDIAPFVAKCPPLLPGESDMQYYALFDMLMEEIRPDTTTEWLALADIAGLCWDVQRYRVWKGSILNIYRRSALETALRDTHRSRAQGFGCDAPAFFGIARKEAEEWRTDPEKRQVLDARLAEHGYDEVALNAGALLEAMEPLSKIERFLSSARGQLNAMLKEVYVRRAFAERARQALEKRLQPAVSATELKQIEKNH